MIISDLDGLSWKTCQIEGYNIIKVKSIHPRPRRALIMSPGSRNGKRRLALKVEKCLSQAKACPNYVAWFAGWPSVSLTRSAGLRRRCSLVKPLWSVRPRTVRPEVFIPGQADHQRKEWEARGRSSTQGLGGGVAIINAILAGRSWFIILGVETPHIMKLWIGIHNFIACEETHATFWIYFIIS